MNRTLGGTLVMLLVCAVSGAGAGEEEHGGLNPQLFQRAADRWGKHLVPIEVWLQRSEGEEPAQLSNIRMFSGRSLRGSGAIEGQYQEKRPVELAGLAVDARTIWMPDLGIERRFIARIAAGAPPAPAVLQGAMLRAPGWIIRTASDLPGIQAIEFAGAPATTEGLYGLGSVFAQGGWTLLMAPASGDYRRQGQAVWTEVPRGLFLLDRELRAVGYAVSGRLGIENAPDVWRGGEIAGGPVLDFAAFDQARETLSKRLEPWALTVRGFFRREEEMEGRRRFRFRYGYDEEGRRNDFLATGYAVGPKTVLVNFALTRDTAMRLERVLVTIGKEEHPAKFLGAFRRYHAFLVELESGTLADPLDLSSPAAFRLSQPLIAMTADHSTGRRRDLIDLNRIADFEKAFRGVLEPVTHRFPRPGTIFIDAEDHGFCGAVLEVDRESEEEDVPRSFRVRSFIDLRIITPAQIRELIAKGAAGFDPRLSPRSAEREKDVVWFGAEFQPISRELAKGHGVEIPTRGGEVGLIVLKVHSGSPVDKAGIVPGDIILSLREEEEPEPWEVSPHGDMAREDSFDNMMLEDAPDDVREELLASAGPPWRSPRNFVTEKLTRIGEGKKVELVCLRDGKERRSWITLVIAPPDFENVRKEKDDALGLTVKDVTYEVRSHYRLKDDAPGVVVSKVEPGGKAAIAKVLPYEILVSINGKLVKDVDDFRRMMDEGTKPDGGDRLFELKLEKMGKSRLVRIRL